MNTSVSGTLGTFCYRYLGGVSSPGYCLPPGTEGVRIRRAPHVWDLQRANDRAHSAVLSEGFDLHRHRRDG
jgi:hypothetical protein